MISKLAKSTVEKWKSEGLDPTFEDIILLGALGCKVENGTEAYSFGTVPRCAFLGDDIIWEPTIAKRLWLDKARQLVSDTFINSITLIAYALHTPMEELPDLQKVSELNEAVQKFTEEVLMGFTETQIFAAISYVMSGNDWRTNEDYTPEQKKSFESVYDIPQPVFSNAKQLLCEALSYGIDGVQDVLVPDLERMIIVAAIHEGVDMLKNEHTSAAGRFYAAAGRIHARLVKEKKHKELTNG